jgi:hypothetical protein
VSKIVIGKSGHQNISFDLDELIAGRLLIQANSGGGKSWLLRRLAEQIFGNVPIIIIDPEGEFATLREKFDFLLVGEGGDIPAHERSAALLAETLLKLKACAVIDLFETYRTNPIGRDLWVKAFLTGLLNAPKSLRHPTVLIIDEAHMFCPEQGESPAEGAMIGAATAGRKRGICAIWATQRLALLNKSASSQLQNRMVGLTFEDVDVTRAVNLLSVASDEQHAFKAKVKVLEPGQFFAFGRAISKTRVLVSVGPVETSHPKVGRFSRSAEPPPAPEKIKALLPKLADLPKSAEEKAKTEAELKREIRELKAALRQQPKPPAQKQEVRVADPRAIERAVAPLCEALEAAMKILVKVQVLNTKGSKISDEEIRKALEATVRDVRRLAEGKIDARARELDHLKAECGRLIKRIEQIAGKQSRISIDATAAIGGAEPIKVSGGEIQPKGPNGPVLASKDTRTKSSHPRPEVSHPESNGDETLSAPRLRILKAIAEFEAIGRTKISKSWIAARSGASYTSSTYGNNLGFLRTSGYITYPGPDQAALTDKGRESAGDIYAPTDSQELLESCLKLLPASQQKILKALHERYPNSVPKGELAEIVGASGASSTYGNNLGALRSAGMIEYPDAGQAKAADWLFLE